MVRVSLVASGFYSPSEFGLYTIAKSPRATTSQKCSFTNPPHSCSATKLLRSESPLKFSPRVSDQRRRCTWRLYARGRYVAVGTQRMMQLTHVTSALRSALNFDVSLALSSVTTKCSCFQREFFPNVTTGSSLLCVFPPAAPSREGGTTCDKNCNPD